MQPNGNKFAIVSSLTWLTYDIIINLDHEVASPRTLYINVLTNYR